MVQFPPASKVNRKRYWVFDLHTKQRIGPIQTKKQALKTQTRVKRVTPSNLMLEIGSNIGIVSEDEPNWGHIRTFTINEDLDLTPITNTTTTQKA